MSLAKLKKAELIALAEANALDYDPDWSKVDLAEELEAAGITAESDSPGVTRETKKERQKRLLARTDRTN